jgi:hypothetical protein
MGANLIARHLPICKQTQEGIDGVVGESPAILRERRRALGIIGQDLRRRLESMDAIRPLFILSGSLSHAFFC